MRHQEKKRARKILEDWLQTVTPEDRKLLAAMICELDNVWVKDVIESGSFADCEAAEKRRKDITEERKAEEAKRARGEAEEHQRRAREFRAGRKGYIPNAPSDLPIHPKLASPPDCVYPERTNCNYDLVNDRCEFMEHRNGDYGRGFWVCTKRAGSQ
jgi:hypothetical protein